MKIEPINKQNNYVSLLIVNMEIHFDMGGTMLIQTDCDFEEVVRDLR